MTSREERDLINKSMKFLKNQIKNIIHVYTGPSKGRNSINQLCYKSIVHVLK